jgi:oligopeptide/dipeptide ABC transporter ATP-binding protein
VREPLLEVRDLKKHFAVGGTLLGRGRGWVKAVDGVNFTIHTSETLGLVGESGCGKTTTSKLILAAEEPTAGVIAFEGRDVVGFSAKELMDYRRKVQVVFQDPYSSLSPRMRVGDIIGEPIVTHERLSRQEVRGRVAELLELVGLRPDLAAVAHISHQIAVMYLGKIVEVADSLELCDKPLHPYTKALFAASLPSHPDEEREEIVLSGEVPSALNPPSGCHFHPRCPFAMPRCSGQEPKLVEVSAGHQVACYLY